MVIGITSLCVIWAVTTFALGAAGPPRGWWRWSSPPRWRWPVAGLIAALARTDRSYDVLASMIGLPSPGRRRLHPHRLDARGLGRVALLTPIGQALRAFADLSAGSGRSARRARCALLAWAVVTGGVAAGRCGGEGGLMVAPTRADRPPAPPPDPAPAPPGRAIAELAANELGGRPRPHVHVLQPRAPGPDHRLINTVFTGDMPVAVLDADGSPASRAIVDASATEGLQVADAGSERAARRPHRRCRRRRRARQLRRRPARGEATSGVADPTSSATAAVGRRCSAVGDHAVVAAARTAAGRRRRGGGARPPGWPRRA